MATQINVGNRPGQREQTRVSKESENTIPWLTAWGAWGKGCLRILCGYSVVSLIWGQADGYASLGQFITNYWSALLVPFPAWGYRVWGKAIQGDMPQLVNKNWPPTIVPVRLTEIARDFQDRSGTWIGDVLAEWKRHRTDSLPTPETVFVSAGTQEIEEDYEQVVPQPYTAEAKIKEGKRTIYAKFPIPDPRGWHEFCKRLITERKMERKTHKQPKFSSRGAKRYQINADEFAEIRDEFAARGLATWAGGNTKVNLLVAGWRVIDLFATTPPPAETCV